MNQNFSLYWDGYGLDAPNSGIFVHAREISRELGKLGCRPRLIGSRAALKALPNLEGISPVSGPISRLLPQNKLSWCEDVRRAIQADRGADPLPLIVHGLSNFNIPKSPMASWRRVLTVHDLIPLLAPREVSKSLYLQLKYLLPLALKAADQIICVSKWTRNTLIDFMPSIAEKIEVIANGVGLATPLPKSPYVENSIINLLFVSRFETYKGHATLVELLKKSKLALRLELITDRKGVEYWTSQAGDLIQSGKVRVSSGVYGEELKRCYKNADIYVSPSRFEGYCLPAIEALSVGTPVVYVGGSGIDEVAGTEVSFKVERPDIVEDWEDALVHCRKVSGEIDFPGRVTEYLHKLVTWKDAAAEHLKLYNRLV